jgi:hypothetical protein
MTYLATGSRTCPGPFSRRSFLQMGAVGLGGMSLADVLRSRAASGEPSGGNQEHALIFIWLRRTWRCTT